MEADRAPDDDPVAGICRPMMSGRSAGLRVLFVLLLGFAGVATVAIDPWVEIHAGNEVVHDGASTGERSTGSSETVDKAVPTTPTGGTVRGSEVVVAVAPTTLGAPTVVAAASGGPRAPPGHLRT